MNRNGLIEPRPFVIDNGQTKSGGADLQGLIPVGVFLPASFTGTTLTFEASYNGTDYFPVHSAGSVLSKTVAQGTFCRFDPNDLVGIRFLKLVSGSTEAATRTLYVALREMI